MPRHRACDSDALHRSFPLPSYAAITTFWNLGMSLGMVVLVAGTSSYVGLRKVLKIGLFNIFRG